MIEPGSKLSFRKKEPTTCPVCSEGHHEEVLRQGGGRLIASSITEELRRLYKKSEKYGLVCPQAYSLLVCPHCLYTALPKDWNDLTPEELSKLKATTQARRQSVQKILYPTNHFDFNKDRNLELGAGSYMLAIDCYNFRSSNMAPTFKKALFSLRAAWLFGDMIPIYPNLPYKNVEKFFHKKAYENYSQVLDLFQSGKEQIESAGRIGPDTDKDWGFEGLQYTVASMVIKIGIEEPNIQKRIEVFKRTKRYLSRMFGSGKANKSKPSDLIDKTRDLYEKMSQFITQWEAQINPGISSFEESP